ncbi:MAG: DUF6702 family protein [Gemmatimonadaceae bacterium]
MPRLFLLFVALLGASPPPAAARHDVHLSHTRMVVDGTTIICRVRVFHDDMETVLRRFTRVADLRIVDGASQDSAFQRYFASKVVMSSGGERLQPRVIQSGRDPESSDSPMWWYLVQYRASTPVQSVAIKHELMFEQFPDQRNIMTVLKMPREERYSLYFAPGESREQVLKF